MKNLLISKSFSSLREVNLTLKPDDTFKPSADLRFSE